MVLVLLHVEQPISVLGSQLHFFGIFFWGIPPHCQQQTSGARLHVPHLSPESLLVAHPLDFSIGLSLQLHAWFSSLAAASWKGPWQKWQESTSWFPHWQLEPASISFPQLQVMK
jgi:hypothetical protein